MVIAWELEQGLELVVDFGLLVVEFERWEVQWRQVLGESTAVVCRS